MNLDQTTVPLEPRRTSDCFDVSVGFFGRQMRDLLNVWVHAALPACVLVYVMTIRSDMDVRLTLVVLYLMSWPMSVVIAAGTSRAVFGERFAPIPTKREAMMLVRWVQMAVELSAVVVGLVVLADVSADLLGTDFVHGQVELMWYALLLVLLSARYVLFIILQARGYPGFWRAFFQNGLSRLAIAVGPMLLLFPLGVAGVLFGLLLSVVSCFVFVRSGFVSESIFLAQLDEQLHSRGVKELIKNEGSSLFFRAVHLGLNTAALALIVFFTLDALCNYLLGYPILIGRLETDAVNPRQLFSVGVSDAFTMLLRDSRCLTVFAGTALLVYPIARIAWFFCYIDLRVRRDCWDMELKFQQLTRRLEGTA